MSLNPALVYLVGASTDYLASAFPEIKTVLGRVRLRQDATPRFTTDPSSWELATTISRLRPRNLVFVHFADIPESTIATVPEIVSGTTTWELKLPFNYRAVTLILALESLAAQQPASLLDLVNSKLVHSGYAPGQLRIIPRDLTGPAASARARELIREIQPSTTLKLIGGAPGPIGDIVPDLKMPGSNYLLYIPPAVMSPGTPTLLSRSALPTEVKASSPGPTEVKESRPTAVVMSGDTRMLANVSMPELTSLVDTALHDVGLPPRQGDIVTLEEGTERIFQLGMIMSRFNPSNIVTLNLRNAAVAMPPVLSPLDPGHTERKIEFRTLNLSLPSLVSNIPTRASNPTETKLPAISSEIKAPRTIVYIISELAQQLPATAMEFIDLQLDEAKLAFPQNEFLVLPRAEVESLLNLVIARGPPTALVQVVVNRETSAQGLTRIENYDTTPEYLLNLPESLLLDPESTQTRLTSKVKNPVQTLVIMESSQISKLPAFVLQVIDANLAEAKMSPRQQPILIADDGNQLHTVVNQANESGLVSGVVDVQLVTGRPEAYFVKHGVVGENQIPRYVLRLSNNLILPDDFKQKRLSEVNSLPWEVKSVSTLVFIGPPVAALVPYWRLPAIDQRMISLGLPPRRQPVVVVPYISEEAIKRQIAENEPDVVVILNSDLASPLTVYQIEAKIPVYAMGIAISATEIEPNLLTGPREQKVIPAGPETIVVIDRKSASQLPQKAMDVIKTKMTEAKLPAPDRLLVNPDYFNSSYIQEMVQVLQPSVVLSVSIGLGSGHVITQPNLLGTQSYKLELPVSMLATSSLAPDQALTSLNARVVMGRNPGTLVIIGRVEARNTEPGVIEAIDAAIIRTGLPPRRHPILAQTLASRPQLEILAQQYEPQALVIITITNNLIPQIRALDLESVYALEVPGVNASFRAPRGGLEVQEIKPAELAPNNSETIVYTELEVARRLMASSLEVLDYRIAGILPPRKREILLYLPGTDIKEYVASLSREFGIQDFYSLAINSATLTSVMGIDNIHHRILFSESMTTTSQLTLADIDTNPPRTYTQPRETKSCSELEVGLWNGPNDWKYAQRPLTICVPALKLWVQLLPGFLAATNHYPTLLRHFREHKFYNPPDSLFDPRATDTKVIPGLFPNGYWNVERRTQISQEYWYHINLVVGPQVPALTLALADLASSPIQDLLARNGKALIKALNQIRTGLEPILRSRDELAAANRDLAKYTETKSTGLDLKMVVLFAAPVLGLQARIKAATNPGQLLEILQRSNSDLEAIYEDGAAGLEARELVYSLSEATVAKDKYIRQILQILQDSI